MNASLVLAQLATLTGGQSLVLGLVALALIVWGIVKIVRDRAMAVGVLLIIVGLLVGPGGVSIWR